MDKGNMDWLVLNICYINRGWLLSFIVLVLGLNIEGLLQDQYMGCFGYVNVTAKVTTRSNSENLNNKQLTIDKCVAICRQQIASYAALQNGTICHCVDDFGIQQPDHVCNMMCAGNQLEYCGGATIDNTMSSINSVSTVYAVCPVGNYGYACDMVCHCKRQIPCHRVAGKCPDGCDGNYTGLSCNIRSLREQYIGCYRDMNDDRALTYRPYDYRHDQTLEMCTTACDKVNSSYAGAQFKGECFCGENYNKHRKLEERNCSLPCYGKGNTVCGGPGVNSIYSVCPFGRYGKGCIAKCNCLNNTRCLYLNGSCPLSMCKVGWTGASCNIRDCTSHNGDCHHSEICSTIDLKFSKLSVCRCFEGFYRRKIWDNCIDKDECLETPSVCGQNALNCTNTIGGYQCACPNVQTRFNMSCMTETENGNALKTNIVGAILGSMICVFVILAIVVVLLYTYRHKGPNIKSTTSGNVCRFGDSAIQGTTCTEESQYEVLSRRSDDTNVYQQIAMKRS